MERYFTTIALLGLNEGNLPVHRGMRQQRYDSVEKMLDLLDVVKRVGPRFPLDAMFLDPHDCKLSLNSHPIIYGCYDLVFCLTIELLCSRVG